RVVGRARGYMLTGTLGGLLSSTSVTLTFARLSRTSPDDGRALAAGTLGANAMLFPRVLVATAILAPPLARSLWPLLLLPCAIAAALTLRGLRASGGGESHQSQENPLHLGAALQMALLFQVVLFGVALARWWFGERGIYASAAVLGLADMDALTISMADLTAKGAAASVAATAVLIGVLANTCVKLTIALVVGRGRFRVLTGAGLAVIGATLVGALYVMQAGGWLERVRAYFGGA
ncbi:MAG: DUF4010 domain-containing protein, partial [Vicinamibacterales bacterium]